MKNFLGLDYGGMIHLAYLVAKRGDYSHFDFERRKSIFWAIFYFSSKVKVKIRTVVIDKKYINIAGCRCGWAKKNGLSCLGTAILFFNSLKSSLLMQDFCKSYGRYMYDYIPGRIPYTWIAAQTSKWHPLTADIGL